MILQAVIVDYGVGNFFSMKCALERAGFNVKVAKSPDNVLEADAVVLPGVGNFKTASKNLKPFKAALSKIIEEGVPLLGVCLGMQLLFEGSEESPGEGLCLLEGNVFRLPDRVKTPHMGWNTLKILRWSPLLDGIDENSYLYFVHSYYGRELRFS
ncbi:imidazole glycerol phosphate synthase subunit HisH [Candidatus Bathyarchaeota archaeon ex4484_40]|nr:MAG: imidazole glycerol phosphate synthase subunit HisH [Candidatus Bathyarchaeota archaeon ex4484_40]